MLARVKARQAIGHRIKPCDGFTLIELLVVIAIVGIIAGILYPVFAGAREKARQTDCASNLRQIALGILQYIEDNDETVPIVEYTTNDNPPNDYFTWVRVVEPYTKSWAIFRCPDSEVDPSEIWSQPGLQGVNAPAFPPSIYPAYYIQQFTPSYGFNYNYLNPWQPCQQVPLINDFFGEGLNAGPPVSLAKIEAPSQTVLIADTKLFGTPTSADLQSDFLDSPTVMQPPIPCGVTTQGWGIGSLGDSQIDNAPLTSTGFFDPRHGGGGEVVFCDAHVKWMLPSTLAAGTNWHPGISNLQVQITDLGQYLWSLSKSGNSDL